MQFWAGQLIHDVFFRNFFTEVLIIILLLTIIMLRNKLSLPSHNKINLKKYYICLKFFYWLLMNKMHKVNENLIFKDKRKEKTKNLIYQSVRKYFANVCLLYTLC